MVMWDRSFELSRLLRQIAIAAIAILASSSTASAQAVFQVLHDFTAAEGTPSSPLVQGPNGNLYGTTSTGGTFNKGTVFMMAPDGTVNILHSFDGTDGTQPTKAFLLASDGNFYGGTRIGGQFNHGTIFRITPDGAFTVLASMASPFCVGPTTLVQTGDGTFYGTEPASFCQATGGGRIFRMTSGGAVTPLYTLTGSYDGYTESPLDITQAVDGSFWISTRNVNIGDVGVIRHMSADGSSLSPPADIFFGHFISGDGFPTAIAQGADARLYVTASGYPMFPDRGRILATTDGSSLTLLHQFSSGPNTSTYPNKLLLANDGQFYGTTSSSQIFNAPTQGLIYRMTSDGEVTILTARATSFTFPLIQASDGTFYGNTSSAGLFDNGTAFRVEPGAPCDYTLSPDHAGFPAGGGNGTASITTTEGCSWDASTSVSWITLNESSGTGSGTLTYGVAPNDRPHNRSAIIRAGFQDVLVTQTAASCQYSLSPPELFVPSGGGTRTATVTATPVCSWTPTSADSWISFGNGGTGDGTFTILVAPNASVLARASLVTIEGRSLVVRQDGSGCQAVGLPPVSGRFGPAGVSGGWTVSTSQCYWAASTTASWLTLSPPFGVGATTLSYQVSPNTSKKIRTGTITVQWRSTATDQTTVVTQRGPQGADFSGDALSEPAVYRPSTGEWLLAPGTVSWGLSTDTPVPDDYDGDGKTDPAIYRPSTGLWAMLKSSTGYTTATYVSWGLSTDVPVPGDYDGDGKADPAIYRPSTGLWAMLKSSTGYTGATYVSWGLSSDVPVQGDYDGDGKIDPAIFRPSTGLWAVLKSSTNYGSAAYVSWGLSTDVPVPGDYDGDGKTDPAVYRSSTGGWHFLQSTTGYSTSAGVSWGVSPDVPVPGDYDGDGQIDPAVFRASTGTWIVLTSSSFYAHYTITTWGTASDIPINKRP